MSEEKNGKGKKSIVPIIAFIISLAAFGLSIFSYNISKNTFTIAQRPWLIVDIVKLENGDYLKIEESSDNTISVSWEYELKNVGNSPAKDIALFKNIAFGNKEIPRDKINFPDVITIGPGQSFYFSPKFDIGKKEGGSMSNIIKEIESNQAGIFITIGFSYANPSITKEKYKTRITHKIAKDSVNIQAPTTMD